jgi:hypothetical protein
MVQQKQHQPQFQTLIGQCLCVCLPSGATPDTCSYRQLLIEVVLSVLDI